MVRLENINDNSVVITVLKHLTILPVNLQEQVLEFVVKLKNSDSDGISANKLIRYAGMISSEDLNIMSQVIQNDCGKIDLNEW